MKLSALALALCALTLGCSPAQDKGENTQAPAQPTSAGQHLDKVQVMIRHQDGHGPTRLDIELALSAEQQERGLMHRTDLKPGDGMLFPMLPARMPAFWMKDTPTSLDLIFIGMEGQVVRVIADTRPHDRTPLFAEEPVAGVLELRGGDASRLGIREGDRVHWGSCVDRPVGGQDTVDPASFCPATH